VMLPEDLREVYAHHFSALSPQSFLKFWGQGTRETVRDKALAREGHVPDSLFFVLRGTVRISRGDRPVTDLAAGYFVAEMSLLTNRAATADAVAIDEVEVMRWPTAQVRLLQTRNPALWSGVQSVLGYDLVEKIKRGTTEKIGARA
jgi:CRP-like cAMP-binding protein